MLIIISGCFYNVSSELRCTLATRESSSLVPWAVAPGAFFFSHEPLFSAWNVLLKLSHEVLDPLLMLQQYRHHNGLKRPRARDHDARLDVQLGAIKESIEEGLIGFRESPFERRPSAAFKLNKLTKRRKGLAHGMILRRRER